MRKHPFFTISGSTITRLSAMEKMLKGRKLLYIKDLIEPVKD